MIMIAIGLCDLCFYVMVINQLYIVIHKIFHYRTLISSEFKAQHLDTNEYLKYIFAYIHLNPLKLIEPNWRERKINKQTANAYLSKYYFSSYQDYIDATREISLILSKDIFPQYFVKKGSFKAYINDWINFDPLT